MGSKGITRAVNLACSSHGLLTASQLRAAECSLDMAERQVRVGSWQRPARGVYALHDRELSGLDLGRVAALLSGGRIVLSGLAVLRELGLRWVPQSSVALALVRPEVRTPSSGRVILRRTESLDALDTWRRGELELAPVARAVVDGAREARSLRDSRGIVLGAVADGWADVSTLLEVLATTQQNGSGPTRRALQDASRGCVSPPEAEVVDALLGCGIPFYVNPQLLLHGRLLGSPDIWLPGLGLGGEVDSVERHEEDDAGVESTYDRHERITGADLELVHLSVRRIRRDAQEAAGYLLARARRRARLPQPEPAGLTVRPRGPLLR